LSDVLHIHAKNWDLVFNTKPRHYTRDGALAKIVEETRLLVRDIRQNVENRNTSFNMYPPQLKSDPQRIKAHQANVAPLNAVADELDARIVDMKRLMQQAE
jgi:hypothetical protein